MGWGVERRLLICSLNKEYHVRTVLSCPSLNSSLPSAIQIDWTIETDSILRPSCALSVPCLKSSALVETYLFIWDWFSHNLLSATLGQGFLEFFLGIISYSHASVLLMYIPDFLISLCCIIITTLNTFWISAFPIIHLIQKPISQYINGLLFTLKRSKNSFLK